MMELVSIVWNNAEVTYIADWIKTVASTSHELNEHNREKGIMMESSVHCMK